MIRDPRETLWKALLFASLAATLIGGISLMLSMAPMSDGFNPLSHLFWVGLIGCVAYGSGYDL